MAGGGSGSGTDAAEFTAATSRKLIVHLHRRRDVVIRRHQFRLINALTPQKGKQIEALVGGHGVFDQGRIAPISNQRFERPEGSRPEVVRGAPAVVYEEAVSSVKEPKLMPRNMQCSK